MPTNNQVPEHVKQQLAEAEWSGKWVYNQAKAEDLAEMATDELDMLRARHAAKVAFEAEQFPYRQALAGRTVTDGLSGLERFEASARKYLVAGVIEEGSYGALGAEAKVGKTWLAIDLAISVALGAAWLGRYACRQGLVFVMLNEGGEEVFWERVKAICAYRGLDVREAAANLHYQTFATRVDDPASMNNLYVELARIRPRLTVIDSWYLSAGNADGQNLATMGAALGNVQGLAALVESALLLTVHWNKTGAGNGPHRWTGTGLQEWARFRIDVSGITKALNDDCGTTVAELAMSFDGAISGGCSMTRTVSRAERHVLGAELAYTLTTTDLAVMTPADGERAKNNRLRVGILRFVAAWPDGVTKTRVKTSAGVGSGGERSTMFNRLIEDGCVEATGKTDTGVGAKTKTDGADLYTITATGLAETRDGGEPVPLTTPLV